MQPGARLAAAIDLLDAIITAARDDGPAADTLVQRYFSTRRYAGARDRRAVRALVYDVIRALGERPTSGRAALIGYARQHDPALLALMTGDGHAPPPAAPDEPAAAPGLAPEWLRERLQASLGDDVDLELAALLDRAPLDLRINRLKPPPAALADARPIAGLADGLRLASPIDIKTIPDFVQGSVEVQDAGSQRAALAVQARAGETIVDLCAGAGGKTLALAAAMDNRGRLIACDSDRARLAQLAPRGARAGVSIIEQRLLDPGREREQLADLAGKADCVLVDAPCSGTGTWRRNPEARWRLTPARLERLVALQARLLDIASELVRPGGRLVYAVCSLLAEEGERQIAAFARQSGWPVVEHLLLTPRRDATDGFFIAVSEKPC